MVPTCMQACKENFERTKVLFGPHVCAECQGCVMSQVYKETNGEHPSTVRLAAIEDRSLNYATSGADAGGGEEPAG
jgi:hypothetical protein